MKARYFLPIVVAMSAALGERLTAQCLFPTAFTVDVGLTVSTTAYRASAPGRAALTSDGSICYAYEVTATTKIRQDGAIEFTQTVTAQGEYIGSLVAPAQLGSCYTSSLAAGGAGLAGSANAGPLCWQGPPPPPPPETTANCDNQSNINCNGSPIIIDKGARFELTGIDDGVAFDLDADGKLDRTSWSAPESEIAFLALDRNGNGIIDDGGELFGNYSRLPNGEMAANGFELLKTLDDNVDSRVDSCDGVWPLLLLWTDRDHDGISRAEEMIPITASGITALQCHYRWTGRRDRHGNVFRWMSSIETDLSSQPIYDVYFRRLE